MRRVNAEAPQRSTAVPWQGLLIGAGAGLLSGLLGIGGGIVIVPALISFMSMEHKFAHGTSLAATLPVGAASLATYAINDNVDWAVAACLAAGAVCGVVLGTHLLQLIPRKPLTIIFIVVILLTAIRLLVASDTTGRSDLTILTAVALGAIGFVTGVLSGMLGIGGGVIRVPALVVLFSMLPVIAKGTSVAVIVPQALIGTIRNRSKQNVDLRIAASVGLAGILTAIVGGVIADSIDATLSNILFAILLVAVALLQARSLRSPVGSPDTAASTSST